MSLGEDGATTGTGPENGGDEITEVKEKVGERIIAQCLGTYKITVHFVLLNVHLPLILFGII
jgi:hypothetical protein